MSLLKQISVAGALAGLLTTAIACGGGTATTAQPTTPPATPVEPAQPTATAEPTAPTASPRAPVLVFPNEEFRKSQPAPGEPRPFQLPSMTSFKLKNGLKVYLVEKHGLPILSMSLNFEGGRMNDPKNKDGLASICMSMVTEGTKSLDKIKFNEALADIASGVSSYAGLETQGIGMRSLSTHFDATFGLFVDSIREPGFRQVDFDRLIKRSLGALKQAKGSAGPVGRRVASSILYGKKHAFGHIVTEKSLGNLKLADCKRYHKQYIKPKGARLFVVGDMTEAQIRKAFGHTKLAKWRGKGKRSARLRKPRSQKGKLFFVDVPGSAQSSIRVMHFGPKRKHKGYFATTMAAAVLGGGFSGRVNMNLREAKGYSYGAYGGFGYSRKYGSFTAATSVRINASWQAVQELHADIKAMKTGAKPATAVELTREKNGAILGLPGKFATARAALSRYRGLVYHHLPLDYYNSYVGKVGAVTLKQLNQAAKKYFEPDQAIYLVVGDATAIQNKFVANGKGDGKGTDTPLLGADGKQVTLLDGLKSLVKSGALGKGDLVVLDTDGNVKERVK